MSVISITPFHGAKNDPQPGPVTPGSRDPALDKLKAASDRICEQLSDVEDWTTDNFRILNDKVREIVLDLPKVLSVYEKKIKEIDTERKRLRSRLEEIERKADLAIKNISTKAISLRDAELEYRMVRLLANSPP